MGAAASMDWWPEGFCELLAESRLVIRYDLRDTGQSITYEPGHPEYTGQDLIADAVGILDALAIERGHLVGMSAGGGIAQHIAVDDPSRVASLTLISTTADGPVGEELPPMSEELQRLFSQPPPEPDWSDRQAVIDYLVVSTVPYQGSVRVEESALRDLLGRVFDRTINIASTMTNHWLLEEGEPVDVGEIGVPTLVMHGTEDPVFPYRHGEVLAESIPGARLVALRGVGHGELPPAIWNLAVAEIMSVTSSS